MRSLLLLCCAPLGAITAAAATPLAPVPLPPPKAPWAAPRAATPNIPSATIGSPPADRATFRAIARAEAEKAKVPFDLVDAVMKIESDYVPTRVGDLDEIGLMQVRPGTAAMLGFKFGDGSLGAPAINIHYGAAYLGEAWRLAGGNVCRALMKYRAGHGNESMTPLSIAYCARAKAHLVAIGSPLAAGIGDVDLIPAVFDPTPSHVPSIREPSGRPKSGAAFWTAFQARIKRINTRIEAKWRRAAR